MVLFSVQKCTHSLMIWLSCRQSYVDYYMNLNRKDHLHPTRCWGFLWGLLKTGRGASILLRYRSTSLPAKELVLSLNMYLTSGAFCQLILKYSNLGFLSDLINIKFAPMGVTLFLERVELTSVCSWQPVCQSRAVFWTWRLLARRPRREPEKRVPVPVVYWEGSPEGTH